MYDESISSIQTKENKMKFLYPLELQVGQKITMSDEDGRWEETIESIPERQGDKVSAWTDQRLAFFDPGLKVQVND